MFIIGQDSEVGRPQFFFLSKILVCFSRDIIVEKENKEKEKKKNFGSIASQRN